MPDVRPTAPTSKRGKRPANMTSHSELSTLSQCEMRWHLRYREHVKGDQSDALRLGSLFHLGAAAHWRGDSWRDVLAAEIVEEGADASLIDLNAIEEDEVVSTVVWLLKRYVRHYEHLDVKVVAQELDLRAKIPGTAQVHQAIIDEVWEVNGRLWVVERKTYGRQDRTTLADVDPQLTNNLWVARANGYDAHGIVFDGAYTYRWKPEKPTQAQLMEELRSGYHGGNWSTASSTVLRAEAKRVQETHPGIERPDSESFDMLWLDRNDEHIAAAHGEIRGAIQRRNSLRRGAAPLRNIGPFCKSCDGRTQCWSRLAFPQDTLIEGD